MIESTIKEDDNDFVYLVRKLFEYKSNPVPKKNEILWKL
jgi:hypothetical protein